MDILSSKEVDVLSSLHVDITVTRAKCDWYYNEVDCNGDDVLELALHNLSPLELDEELFTKMHQLLTDIGLVRKQFQLLDHTYDCL